MFPGVLAVQDHGTQRIRLVCVPSDLLDVANHKLGRALRFVARRCESDEVAESAFAKGRAHAGVAELSPVALKQQRMSEDFAGMQCGEAAPQNFLLGREP